MFTLKYVTMIFVEKANEQTFGAEFALLGYRLHLHV